MSALPALDPVVHGLLRLALAGLFAWAALHKARDLPAFRRALADYELLPRVALGPAALLLCTLEGGIALGLLWPGSVGSAALGAGGLLLLYAAALSWKLLRGRRDLDCGCVGPMGGRGRRGLGPELLLRNGILALAAFALARPAPARGFEPLDLAVISLGAATLLLVYAAAEVALQNHRSLVGEARRRSP